ncbi:TrbC/VirB2 family protein [uncultured Roseibium sp.]|uniref:TrbC/VirB2 family protein n=1 Tax=uncultured Roseibium sp. TaxID=1936171 RepID=UPI002617293E|nr:TrbC/VirB2 family protein [uncultured Roseibium sp.]
MSVQTRLSYIVGEAYAFADQHKSISAAVAITLFLTNTAHAAKGSIDLSPVTNVIDALQKAITGPLGTAICIIALAATGFMFFTGRIDWMRAAAVILGIIFVFGGATIVKSLGGKTTAP